MQNLKVMTHEQFDVIIVGGSYSGLAAAMGLGRALRKVLVVDSGLPANHFTPESHNFLTHDGRQPSEITNIARQQVDQYKSVKQISGLVVGAEQIDDGFQVRLHTGETYRSIKLLFASGIVDIVPEIPGFAECWGKSVLHCPYCHGYEVRNENTGIFGNGDYAFEFGALISNWTSDLTIYTNGHSTLTGDQTAKLLSHNIKIVEDEIGLLKHDSGFVERIVFKNGSTAQVRAIYTKPGFKQHSDVPKSLGCEVTSDGYIMIDSGLRTSVPGVYACGDNVTRTRTVANAIAMGTTAAITINKDMILHSF
jgi:thioredoxin reductase